MTENPYDYTMPSSSRKLIKIAHSPDSDDAYMFYALAHGKIPQSDFEFEFSSAEIEKLNQEALINNNFDICALSFHAYALVADRYQILSSGASMAGPDYGPRLVAPRPLQAKPRIAIPGQLTSAYLVLQLYYQELGSDFERVFCSFDEVFDLITETRADAALLIHESQLKYQELDYQLILDLGAWWYQLSKGRSMPLGCNAVARRLSLENRLKLSQLMQASIAWGLAHPQETLSYARDFAANNLNDSDAAKYISMYVNEQTLALSAADISSIELMFKLAQEAALIQSTPPLDLI